MKKGIALLLACALTLFSFACAEQTTDASSMDVRLTENPTTGYTWSAAVNNGDVLAVIDNGYTANEATAMLEGGGGTHSWTITGLGKGEATALFSLVQSGSSVAEATVGYTFTVDDQSKLTMTSITGIPEAYMPGYAAVELLENPTTGYEWSYTLSAEGILTPGRDAYVDTSTSGEALMGAGGLHFWTFKGTAPGDVTLTYIYTRSWEEGVDPEATIVYAGHVDDALNVTLTTDSEDYAQYDPYAAQTEAQ